MLCPPRTSDDRLLFFGEVLDQDLHHLDPDIGLYHDEGEGDIQREERGVYELFFWVGRL